MDGLLNFISKTKSFVIACICAISMYLSASYILQLLRVVQAAGSRAITKTAMQNKDRHAKDCLKL